MSLFVIAGYFVVSFVIYSVLTKLAAKGGLPTERLQKAIILLALIWPLWGEVAILAALIFLLVRALRSFNESESRRQRP